MKKINLIYTLLFVAFLFSCSSDDDNSNEDNNSEFFDFVDEYAASFFNIEPFPALTPTFPDVTIDDAYDFQDMLVDELEDNGVGQLTGYKLGFTGEMRPLGAPKPLFGRLYSTYRIPAGSSLSKGEDFIGGSVGFEVAIFISEDVDTFLTPEEAMDVVSAIAPAMEFADFGFTPNNMVIDYRDIIATNSASRYYMIGDETPLQDLLNQDIDPNDIDLVGSVDGEILIETRVGLPVEGLFKAVSFLTGELADRGLSLREGDVILTGAIMGDQDEGPGTYFGDYDILGTIEFTLTE